MAVRYSADPAGFEQSFLSGVDATGRFLRLLENRIPKPIGIIESNHVRGFRFASPGPIQYVVLNISRSLSLINAAQLLLENGFQGEFAILARAILENTSKLAYVVGGISAEGIDKKTDRFLREFFSDAKSDANERSRYQPIPQKDIHRRNSEKITRDIQFNKTYGLSTDLENSGDKFAALESHLYNVFSNHVHGRYPEMMDVYGEFSISLKLQGNFESKDIDSPMEIELIADLADRVSKGFRIALMHLNMAKLISLSADELRFCVGDAFRT